MMKMRLAIFGLLVLATFTGFSQTHHSVLMISIDGMRPDYVTHADEHGLRIPNLRQFVSSGTFASGVRGVYPTVTYPSHTTLVTGVWPAEHGIFNNLVFDPERRYDGEWYWYADEIRVPTLWDAAHAAGLRTASVSWPVTVDSNVIDYNVPEYWRGTLTADGGSPGDRFMMDAVSRPDGELEKMEQRLGPYMKGDETTIDGDRTRTAFAVDILRRHHPDFMTVHLSSLDEEEHVHGPFSAEADANLEVLDGFIGELVAAAREANANTTVIIVSDHGFASIHDAVNLFIPFLQAGLITPNKSATGAPLPTIESWIAEPWMAGGMAAIVLHNPEDAAARDQVKQLLDKLAADPANGIDRVLTGSEVQQLGGFPTAAFLITFRIGYSTGSATSGPLLTPTPGRGTHGYPPDDPDMLSSFFAIGPQVTKGQNLGVIDMRQIAPTIAGLLGVALPTAREKPLAITTQTAR